MEWQPIATAPKDGTRIFAWLPDEGFPVLAAWLAWDSGDEPDWFVFEIHGYAFCEPTHWMPLPQPPEAD